MTLTAFSQRPALTTGIEEGSFAEIRLRWKPLGIVYRMAAIDGFGRPDFPNHFPTADAMVPQSTV